MRYRFHNSKIKKIFKKTNGLCFYCGQELPKDTDIYDENDKEILSRRNWEIDHVIPVSKGGDNDINNLVPSCRGCNQRKADS